MRLSKWFSAALLLVPFFANAALADYPNRGMSMNGVKAQYGEPQSISQSAGPIKKRWPLITVWHYGAFSVYFERHTVLHTVVH
ncbi:MAG: hypothetical protein BWK73_11610 [Thiothrix lacustris]|uniref:Uncharacterized protein n=1 Tax=Thiothrix lacustris TaxID=525917 RepID=A0A1Y1QTT5_9GAMM|nr:MAG: hypothetical protein BWK73_11610 [Thiothrix lacustris]